MGVKAVERDGSDVRTAFLKSTSFSILSSPSLSSLISSSFAASSLSLASFSFMRFARSLRASPAPPAADFDVEAEKKRLAEA